MPILKVKYNDAWEEVAGASWHTHVMDDITNFPSNLPVDVLELQNLVGDKAVSDQIVEAIANKADIDHVHENFLQLYDTVSGAGTIEISNAVSGCELEIKLSSEIYSNFSNIKVGLVSGDIFNTVMSNADGVVIGLNSTSDFNLTLSSADSSINLDKIVINCTYQIDLNKVLIDRVLHVENVVVDETFSESGSAADAKLTGDAITNINNEIDRLSDVAFSGDYNDLANKPDIVNSNVIVSDTYDATSGDAMSGKAVAQALQTISVEATEQVQADWSQTDNTAADFIKNKPTIPEEYVHPENHPATMITGLADVATSGSYNDLSDKPTIPSIDGLATKTYVDEEIAKIDILSGGTIEQVQSDWDETDITSPAYIKNKPSISGEGGASVQANWGQIDSAQADYIRNKPFGEYEGISDILPLTTYDNFYLSSTYGVYAYTTMPTYELILGEVYTVLWDGIEYECTAQDASALASGAVLIGNASAFGLSGNNEPFIIACIAGQGAQYFALTDTQEGNSHSVGIKQNGILAKPLDNRYLDFIKQIQIDILPFVTLSDFALNSTFGVYCVFGDPDFTLTIGETYKVYWDGTEYECVAQDASSLLGESAVVVGNASAFGLSGNDEPFIIEADIGGTIYIALTDTEEGNSHDVGIDKEQDIIKEEYIPEISSLPEITTDDNGKVLGIVEGVWTVTNGLPEITTDDNNKVLKVVEGAWTVSDSLPEVTTDDAGKFLRVSSEGTWVAQTVLNAEEVGF